MLSKYLRLFSLLGEFDPDTNRLKDHSLDNQNGNGILCTFDYLYIAQHYPFANMFALMDVLNVPENSVPTVALITPYDVVGPVDEVRRLSFSIVPTSGTYKLTYNGNDTVDIPYDATSADIETALRALPALENVTVALVAENFDITFVGVADPLPLTATVDNLVNDLPSKFKVEYHDGVCWRDAVDILDSTDGLKQSAMIQYTTRNKYMWNREAETEEDSSCPDELKGLYIDDCYWMRLSFSTANGYKKPNPLTKIKKICYAFTTTEQVNSVDTDAPKFYKSFTEQPNKSNWIPEIIHASEEMVLNLKEIGFIKSAGEIVEFDELYLACAFKTLAHIYFQLGKAYETDRAIMTNKYEKALGSKALTFDKNKDAKIDKSERNKTSTRMKR